MTNEQFQKGISAAIASGLIDHRIEPEASYEKAFDGSTARDWLRQLTAAR
jgi:hypothetical protein